MDFLTNQKLWNSIITTPPVRWMLKITLKKCSDCNQIPLETALYNFGKNKNVTCSSCGFYVRIISFWVIFIQKVLSVEKSRIKKIFQDSYVRRAIFSIVSGFFEFGFKRPIQVHAPFLVVWNFTYKCNLNCKHCYSSSGKNKNLELSTNEALKVVDQIADFGVTSLAFSGGEPLMRKDFYEVASHAVDSGLYVSLATNGTLLTEENVNKLKRIGVHYVEVSLDGIDPKTHDFFRGKIGAFDQTLTGLKTCLEKDICTCIAVTATKNNLKEIPYIIDLAEEIGAERFTYFNFVPTGRGKELYDQDLSPEEREELMSLLLRRISKGGNSEIHSLFRTKS